MKKVCTGVVLFSMSLLLVAVLCKGIEIPEYRVIDSTSEFQVRLYNHLSWMTASVEEISFHKATRAGFHRLFQYIEGANLNNSRVSMTAPVVTSIVPDAGPLHSSAYLIRFYLPVKFQAEPSIPLPELNLRPDAWPCHCIAVRKFSGFARDSNIVEEAKILAESLSRSPWANSTLLEDNYAYSIAQYSSPLRIIGRLNEVWVGIDGSKTDRCPSSGIAAY